MIFTDAHIKTKRVTLWIVNILRFTSMLIYIYIYIFPYSFILNVPEEFQTANLDCEVSIDGLSWKSDLRGRYS